MRCCKKATYFSRDIGTLTMWYRSSSIRWTRSRLSTSYQEQRKELKLHIEFGTEKTWCDWKYEQRKTKLCINWDLTKELFTCFYLCVTSALTKYEVVCLIRHRTCFVVFFCTILRSLHTLRLPAACQSPEWQRLALTNTRLCGMM